MEVGDYRLEIIPDTEFRLDGGAMFGVVPRVLWERVCPPDELNRVRMNMNCVFLDTGREKVLIETGIGEKWGAKETSMYGIFRERPFADTLFETTGCTPDDITLVVNTHLHFDHAGGNTIAAARAQASRLHEGEARTNDNNSTDTESDAVGNTAGATGAQASRLHEGEARTSANESTAAAGNRGIASETLALQSQFRNARYLVSASELTAAQNPHERDRASYLPVNWQPLIEAGQLDLQPDDCEVVPGLRLQTIRGHSLTMQTWRLDRGDKTVYGFADLIPTRHHLPPAWIMGYDLYPTETLEFKKRVLPEATRNNWICLFYHDIDEPLRRLESINGKLTSIAVQ